MKKIVFALLVLVVFFGCTTLPPAPEPGDITDGDAVKDDKKKEESTLDKEEVKDTSAPKEEENSTDTVEDIAGELTDLTEGLDEVGEDID
ncbi:MAG: hypothetical protein ABIE23_03895 [archaeon]|nr:hypothetical protein [Candidatus Micrarchaeota archaeon]